MRKLLAVTLLIGLVLSVSGVVFAQAPATMTTTSAFNARYLQSEGASLAQPLFLQEINRPIARDEDYYSDSWANKMGNGVINTTTSWMDLPNRVAEVSEEHNILVGMTIGATQGIASGLVRGASGVYDMATFGFSPYDRPPMKPEYKVEKPDEGFKIKLVKW